MSYSFDKQSVRRITNTVLRSEGSPPVSQRINGPPTRFPRTGSDIDVVYATRESAGDDPWIVGEPVLIKRDPPPAAGDTERRVYATKYEQLRATGLGGGSWLRVGLPLVPSGDVGTYTKVAVSGVVKSPVGISATNLERYWGLIPIDGEPGVFWTSIADQHIYNGINTTGSWVLPACGRIISGNLLSIDPVFYTAHPYENDTPGTPVGPLLSGFSSVVPDLFVGAASDPYWDSVSMGGGINNTEGIQAKVKQICTLSAKVDIVLEATANNQDIAGYLSFGGTAPIQGARTYFFMPTSARIGTWRGSYTIEGFVNMEVGETFAVYVNSGPGGGQITATGTWGLSDRLFVPS